METRRSASYYKSVGRFYDQSSGRHDQLYWSNSTLQRIRQSFREHLKKQQVHGKHVLEVGFGTGIDLVHFSTIFPQSHFYGIDVSHTMLELAKEKIVQSGCRNAHVRQGSVEDIGALFPGVKFDLIYVFFGALNTVKDLRVAMKDLDAVLKPDGKMVLTFVNKYYLAEILIMLLKLKFKKAFARLRDVWTGYSQRYRVVSRCYSPRQIRTASLDIFTIRDSRGFSITYPAWYRDRWVKRMGSRASGWLWKIDQLLNKTFAWKFGEYSLFVMDKNK